MSVREGKADEMEKALARVSGRRGGKARAAKMTPTQRKEAARHAAKARWAKAETLPQATHWGELKLGNATLQCAVLSDGRRIISQQHVHVALGGTGQPSSRKQAEDESFKPPVLLSAKNLQPFITEELASSLNSPIHYRVQRPQGGGTPGVGIEASTLPRICSVWLDARSAGVLRISQQKAAQYAELLLRGLAEVGVVALVDEATGYQYDRARDALAEILEKFIAENMAKWVKTFPDEFYRQLFRLRGLSPDNIRARPQYFGKLTNDIVYARLAPQVLEKLKEVNPRLESGTRRSKHHQWLSRDIGHPALREHLASVVTLMKLSQDYTDFKSKLDKIHPPYTPQLNLFPDD